MDNSIKLLPIDPPSSEAVYEKNLDSGKISWGESWQQNEKTDGLYPDPSRQLCSSRMSVTDM